MMYNFNQRLDLYLTTPPESGFIDYYESVFEILENKSFDQYNDFICENEDVIDNWISKLYYHETPVIRAQKVLVKAIKMYGKI